MDHLYRSSVASTDIQRRSLPQLHPPIYFGRSTISRSYSRQFTPPTSPTPIASQILVFDANDVFPESLGVNRVPSSYVTQIGTRLRNMNGNYSQRNMYGHGQYSQYSQYQGMNMGQGPLTNLSGLSSALPSPITTINPSTGTRADQNNHLMVLQNGEHVPIPAFLPNVGHMNDQVTSNNRWNGLNNPGAGNAALHNNPMMTHAGMQGMSDIGHGYRASWQRNDENAGFVSANGAVGAEFYPGYPYQPVVNSDTYVAGPIQPMKTKDNKSYEMVNLDELVMREPSIPRAVPALWTNQEELSLAKCLQNPEGITNIYIRGFMPDTTDEDLHRWASRFGEIESCKAIIEQDTGKCKGFGFVMYYSPASAENCIRGFFHLGFQASYAQKSRNARLKDLEDRSSTNIYCTGVPIDWNEADLAKHFLPFRAISTKICRDTPSGVSKEVGFARFETREIAERIVKEFHSVLAEHDGVKLFLRFADTKAQKQLKLQSQERRTWRSREYSYSVEHTPSPTLTRFQNVGDGVSPASYQSPTGGSHNFTPDTSVSPPEAQVQTGKQVVNNVVTTASRTNGAWPIQGGLQTITNTTVNRATVNIPVASQPVIKTEPGLPLKDIRQAKTPSPKKAAAGKENVNAGTPKSTD